MDVSLINIVNQSGLILEQMEEKDSALKKTLMDLGGIIDGTFTFGTGIGAMLPAVKQLMSGVSPELTEQDVILLYITAMWILLNRHKEKVDKLVDVIKNRGLISGLSTVLDFLKSVEDIAIKIGNSLGYTASSLADIVAFTFIAFPILDGILFLMNQGLINPGSPTGYLKSVLIGVGIVGFKNIFNHIIKKLGGKLKPLDNDSDLLNESVDFYKETLTMVNDIMSVIKNTTTEPSNKTYYLPEDIRPDELVYELDNYSFTIELTLGRDENVEDEFNIEAYYAGDDVIEIILIINPLKEPESYTHIENYLVEYVRHEIRHAEQEVMGTSPDKTDDDLTGLTYYSQPHEIDAQTSGLNARRIKQNRSFEEIVKGSVENTKLRYGLSDEEAEELYNILLKDIKERYGEKSTELNEQTDNEVNVRKKVVLDNEDYRIYVPLDRDGICNIPNTNYCVEYGSAKIQSRSGTPYVIEFKKDSSPVKIGGPNQLLLIDYGKIPFLREPDSNKAMWNTRGIIENLKELLSQEKELQKFFHLKYSLPERIKYNMEFDEDVLLDGKEHSKLGELIYNINNNNADPADLEEYYGEFEPYRESYYTRGGEDEIEIVPDGINVYLKKDDWLENILELNGDSYYYDLAYGSYNYDYHYDELSDDELNYISCWFNDNQLSKITELMNLVEGTDKPLDRHCTTVEDGEINEFFENYFPSEWNDFSGDLLYEVGRGIGENRVEELRKWFEDEIYLDFEHMGDTVKIHVGWEPLLYLVSLNLPETIEAGGTLDELFKQPINSLTSNPQDIYYDSYDWAEGTQEEVESLMDGFLEKLDDSDISRRKEFVDKVNDFLKKEDFKKPTWGSYKFFKEYGGNDNFSYKKITVKDINPENETISVLEETDDENGYRSRESFVKSFEDFARDLNQLSLF
jgi:hypothetical protein